jgi:hypothetical protein
MDDLLTRIGDWEPRDYPIVTFAPAACVAFGNTAR